MTAIVIAFGYVLALLSAGLFAVECHLRQAEKRRHRRELARRDKHIEALAGRNGFLDRQNRALFGRCAQHHTNRRCARYRHREGTWLDRVTEEWSP